MFIPPVFGGAVKRLTPPFYPVDLGRETLNPIVKDPADLVRACPADLWRGLSR
jgi:hypothetical protein